MGASGGAGSDGGLVSVSGAVAPTGAATGDRRCDAEDIPEQSQTSSPDEDSNESGDEPPPEFIVDSGLKRDFGPPPTPAIQPDVRTNEVRLSVSQLKDCKADLALCAFTARHGLTQESIADLLKLSSTAAKCRTPYRMERFIDASVNLEKRFVDCYANGCVAYTHTRTLQTACDCCGAARYKSNGQPVKQVTYWSLTSWLAHLLGDPVIGKSMLQNMAAARKAADEGADGVHDYAHGTNFRHYRDKGLLDQGPFVPLNWGTDGFQFFRQNGFEGWPVIVTPLSMSPEERTRNKYQLLLVVTPGPRQPADLESFLHPIAEELDALAKGIPGLIVPNSATPVVLGAGVLNFTTDQPGGDKLGRFTGVSSYVYNRLRNFKGVYVPASSHVYFPPKDPASGETLFQVQDCTARLRTAASIAASAGEVEDARAAENSVAYQTRLQNSGVKEYSLFFAPSPAMRAAYPHLEHLCSMGPTAAPYDTMHVVLLNVVPHLWMPFAGLKLLKKNRDETYIMPKATVSLIGRELRGARPTVPLAQARTLRNIDVHLKSFKAVDWMHFILCSGEVLLAGRVPTAFYNIFMALSRACRLLFRPRGVTKAEIEAIDGDIKYFVSNYYAKIYRGTAERLPLCLSTIASLLDVVPLLWACGPA